MSMENWPVRVTGNVKLDLPIGCTFGGDIGGTVRRLQVLYIGTVKGKSFMLHKDARIDNVMVRRMSWEV